MIKWQYAVLAAILMLSYPAFAQFQDALVVDGTESSQPNAEFKLDSIIVKPREAARTQNGIGILSDAEALPLGLAPAPQMGSGGTLIYEVNAQILMGARSEDEARARILGIIEQLSARSDVEYAEPNYIAKPYKSPNDPGFPIMWHYHSIANGIGGASLPPMWDRSTGEREVVVAIVDTGSLYDEPDIAGSGNLVAGYDFISEASRANDGDGRDSDATDPGDAVGAGLCYPGSPARGDSWHGTHVSGTIGAGKSDNSEGISGVAWQVSVVPVRVLGKCGGTFVDINDAIRWAAGIHVPGVPDNPLPARVINMSLGADGISCPQSQQEAIDDAYFAGALVVVAAGNNSADASLNSPASCNHVVTVAAHDARGHLARYSAFGDVIDIMAPGGDVRRDDNVDDHPDGVLSYIKGGYAWYNGTSMAAPHVSGVAALALAQNPQLTPDELSKLIKQSAVPRSADDCPQPCGYGMLNANIMP